MEKFCIVKRRKQTFQDPFPSLLPIEEEAMGFRETNVNSLQKIHPNQEPVLSFGLTPWQGRALRSSGILPFLEKETPKNLNLTMHQEENGSVVFNFHLDLDRDFEMFKPNQVCQMMQISRTLLNRMVHENRIKSYKIGRLRRFSLKDILETLNQKLIL
ncbi:MAG: helix-turn-helix domain-containing protein [Deltaproteobacteria bacterium]|nr:helix-turn-helix domain-containing protein [Deltaproteobacteria bacterium]